MTSTGSGYKDCAMDFNRGNVPDSSEQEVIDLLSSEDEECFNDGDDRPGATVTTEGHSKMLQAIKKYLAKTTKSVDKLEKCLAPVDQASVGLDRNNNASASDQRVVDLKRKLATVMKELSKSRMEGSKRQKKNERKDQMIIDVPDYPMEFYKTPETFHMTSVCSQSAWYGVFNDWINHQANSEYLSWINTRVTGNLPDVLAILTNPDGPWLKPRQILPLRLVSKDFKAGVEKFLKKDDDCLIRTVLRSKDGKKVRKLVKYLGTFQDGPPPLIFPSRSVLVKISAPKKNEEEGFVQFHIDLDILFRMCGGAVERFAFSTYQDNHQFNYQDWSRLTNWLETMPSLKGFTLHFAQSRGIEETSVSSELLPFPTMPSLTRLTCRRVSSTQVNSILYKNPSISSLETQPPTSDPSHLQHLNKSIPIQEFTLTVTNPRHVLLLEPFPWKLTKLNLSFINNSSRLEFLPLQTVFKMVQKFSQTLTSLSINLPVDLHKETSLSLSFPKLTNLALTVSLFEREPINYDFLLPLTSLQTLRLSLPDNKPCSDQLIKIRGYLRHLQESNIWSLFPALQTCFAIISSSSDKSTTKNFKYSRKFLTNLTVNPLSDNK